MKNLILLMLFCILSSCVSINTHTEEPVKKDIPVQHTFKSSYEQVWNATIRALAQKEAIKTINKDAGIIVTEYGTIDERDVGMMQSLFFGKIYKYSFSINLLKKTSTDIDLIVRTNLKVIRSSVWTSNSTHEFDEKNPRIESFMRKELFIRICKQLYSGQNERCDSLFSKNSQPLAKETSPIKISESSQPPMKAAPISEESQVFEKKGNTIIFQVQERLTERGYNPGPVDGLMGSKTRNAIIHFQKDLKIKVTGIADSNTLIALDLKEGIVEYTSKKGNGKTESEKIKAVPTKSEETEKNMELKQPAVVKVVEEKTIIGKGKLIETTSLLLEPSFMAEIIKQIPSGQLLELLEREGEFYKVRYQGGEGYVYVEFVTKL